MTIIEYVKINNISYRELSRRLNISVIYLCDLSKGKRKTISEQVANKFKKVAPEIDIIIETRKYYRIKENSNENNKARYKNIKQNKKDVR